MENSTETTYCGPTPIIDLQTRREQKLQQLSTYLEAMEGIHALREQIAEYDFYMSVLALEMDPASFADLSDRSLEQQIQEDLRRLNGLVDSLESIVSEFHGISLETALHLLIKQASPEILDTLAYLAITDCPFLAKMQDILHGWTSREGLERQA